MILFAAYFMVLLVAPRDEMNVSTVVDLEQTFADFISAYEIRMNKTPASQPKNYRALLGMRTQLADFRLNALSRRISDLGPCGSFVASAASLKYLGAPAAVALRMHYVLLAHEVSAKKLIKRNIQAIQKNENDFFKCIESYYSRQMNEASLQGDFDLIKKMAEKLFAD